ncbi:serine/threonine protein kinase [Loktanella sp. 5RATIMAR09]|uniref:serine/threonine-protein kinase n=1 Tax=Loktanella sp. 5RATIMAR09 TaxID=1225655 RepID=UPI0006EB81A2|nr:serine/threonine-protein kinase [Loktanella sp. 5RATIMAR09]KQI71716.1 serine/threonine protein kinase [Loktanella sp. 5RATIMAR09]
MAKPQMKEDTTEKDSFVDELKPGTKLMHGQYTIESFLNAGGFGITYLAKDSLDRKVVIKECFPGAFCRRSRYVVQARSRAHQNELKSIVRLFVQEARSLAKLNHPNIVGVHQVFEDNETAYMALDFVTGRDLLDTIEDPNHGLNATQIKSILKEVLGAVGFIHDQGILHRDISPDNILINKDFHPVLIDFGAAREEATKQSRVLSALRVVKDGYSPQEFYIAGSEQSPSSDLYALGASFYHLINGEVPPNSQARLAAIASGEPDPYQPLAGRFDEYEASFLTAMDKALAVLPKDRVQSAKEWIEIMEGGQSNVTPLKVGATAAAEPQKTATKAPVAAAAAKKSNMPILLGSAAAVALLVGVGVMTMTGGEDAPVVAQDPVATAAPATVEAPVVAEAPAAPAVAPAPAPAPEVAAEPVVTEEPAFLAPPAEESAPAVAEPAPSDAEQLAASIAAEQTPAITQEPAPEETAIVPPVVIEPPVAAVTPAPAIRPAARPESVEIAALPAPEPLPEPVATPQPAADQPVSGDVLATANRPVEASEIAPVALPTTPENVESVGSGPTVEISAVTPGNELPPATVSGSWTVQLPFTAAGDQSNIVAEAGLISPVWVEPGLVIVAVNGVEIDAISDIPAALRQQIGDGEVAPTIPVSFNTIKPSTGDFVQYNWVVPVVQNVTLVDGTAFQTAFSGTGWTTSVVALDGVESGGLQVGDVITSYISTGETIDQRDSIMNIFERELANGTEQFSFAVQRDGGLWVASHTVSDAAE